MDWRPKISRKQKKELVKESKDIVTLFEMTLLDLEYVNKKPTNERLKHGISLLYELRTNLNDLQARWEDLLYHDPSMEDDLIA